MDSREKWRPFCLAILSVEDVEDVYIIGIMITGFLLFGVCRLLFYRKARKAMAACSAIEKLPVIDGLCRATNTQTQVICKLNMDGWIPFGRSWTGFKGATGIQLIRLFGILQSTRESNPPPPVNFVSGSELFVVVSTATDVVSSPASDGRDTVESGWRWSPWAHTHTHEDTQHTHPLDGRPSGLPPPLRPSLQYSMPQVMRRARWLRPPPGV